jgi:hypothetical protein
MHAALWAGYAVAYPRQRKPHQMAISAGAAAMRREACCIRDWQSQEK